jgi:hypothetical protein
MPYVPALELVGLVFGVLLDRQRELSVVLEGLDEMLAASLRHEDGERARVGCQRPSTHAVSVGNEVAIARTGEPYVGAVEEMNNLPWNH